MEMLGKGCPPGRDTDCIPMCITAQLSMALEFPELWPPRPPAKLREPNQVLMPVLRPLRLPMKSGALTTRRPHTRGLLGIRKRKPAEGGNGPLPQSPPCSSPPEARSPPRARPAGCLLPCACRGGGRTRGKGQQGRRYKCTLSQPGWRETTCT